MLTVRNLGPTPVDGVALTLAGNDFALVSQGSTSGTCGVMPGASNAPISCQVGPLASDVAAEVKYRIENVALGSSIVISADVDAQPSNHLLEQTHWEFTAGN